ncbi:MAG: sugar phosphate isomerase/epimerase [Bacteroidetes bacterium]|nr:sugar phosphate isomerase/epimerase [Bacteroidota bacterium]
MQQFFRRLSEEQYDGVEINLPYDPGNIKEFCKELDAIRTNRHFIFIAQQVLPQATESVNEYIHNMKARIEFLASLKPDFINSHTGKDYFSFDDNCRIIDWIENWSNHTGVPVYHETHRGRFTFHASSLLPYLQHFPTLKLTGDFSHWCTVSESMLADQESILEKIIPHVHHIHARIGYEHSPQVNDPAAPEWSPHIEIFLGWWTKILTTQSTQGKKTITITPEFGPTPYMPVLPYSQKPLSDQWDTNVWMKNKIQERLTRTSNLKQDR